MNIFSSVAKVFARAKPLAKRSRGRLWLMAGAVGLIMAGIGAVRSGAQSPAESTGAIAVASPSPSVEEINEPVKASEPVAAAPSSANRTEASPVVAQEADLPSSLFAAPADVQVRPAATEKPAVTPALGTGEMPPPRFAPPADAEVSAPAVPEPTPLVRTGDVVFATPPGVDRSGPTVMIGRPVERNDYGTAGNRRAVQLRSMPPETFTFDRASLRDVLRFLAEAAGLPYVGIPEHAPEAQKLVTFRMTASPFVALESVARQNDVKLAYEDGVWFMRLRNASVERARQAEDQNELVGVIYQLRHDPGDRIGFSTEASSGTSLGGSAGLGAGVMGGQTGGAGTVGGGQTGPASPQLPLQNPQYVFTARSPKIVNDIRTMLGLKPLEYQADGSVVDPEAAGGAELPRLDVPSSDGSVLPASGSAGATPAAGGGGLAALMGGGAPATAPAATGGGGAPGQEPGRMTPVYVPPQKPQVIYNADNNVIWVVATRKQHKWVAEYLQRVDQPQDLIAIEVKFVETKKNPQYDFGINWQNMLGTGITVRGSANAGIGGEYGFGFDREKEWGSTNSSSSGFDNNASLLNAINNAIINNQTNLTITDIINSSATGSRSSTNTSFNRSSQSQGSRNFNLDFRGQNTTIPYEAVLSLDEVSVTLQAFMQDRDTSIVQYPRVLTINNREVAITSAENTPVNAGVTQTQSGSAATQTGTLGYLPIGTQINILPKVVGKNEIALTVAVTISSIIGTVPINLGTGFNEYPITTERVYNATLQVDSGYTLAVGGLEKVDDRDVQGGVPVLKDLPGIGNLFKNKNKARNRTNLIIFITPYVISDPSRTPGIGETPVSIVPMRPGTPPTAPTFTPDGRLAGGDSALAEAFAWLEFQLRYFRQINEENMVNLESIDKLRGVISVARVLLADLQLEAGQPPYDIEQAAGERALRAETLLADLNRTLAAAQEDLF